jgi:hypothetical protein
MKLAILVLALTPAVMAEEWKCQVWKGDEPSKLERTEVTPQLDGSGNGSKVTGLRAYNKYQFCIKGEGVLELSRDPSTDSVMVIVTGGNPGTKVIAYGKDK